MKTFSLNRRLIAAVVLSQVLLAVGLVVVGTSFSHYYIRSAFDVYLEGRAQSIAALVYFPGSGKRGLLFISSKVPPSPHNIHKDIFLVQSDHGDFEMHSPFYLLRFSMAFQRTRATGTLQCMVSLIAQLFCAVSIFSTPKKTSRNRPQS